MLLYLCPTRLYTKFSVDTVEMSDGLRQQIHGKNKNPMYRTQSKSVLIALKGRGLNWLLLRHYCQTTDPN